MALSYLDKAAYEAGVYKDKGNDDDTQQDTSSEDSGYSASGILSAAKNILEHPFQGMGTVIAPNYTPRPLDDSVYSDIPGTPVASGQFGELEDESVRDERMKDSADYMAANWPRLYGGVVAADEGLANVVGGIQNAVGGGNGILTNVQRAEEGMQNYRDQWNNEYGDSYLLNPNKFATDVGSGIGSTVPIMALSALMPGAAVAGGTRALTSALSRAGLGRLAMSKAGQALIADTVRSPISSLADSLSEYGTVVNDMMQNGMSEDEARRRAIPMFFKNMALDTFTVPLELGVMKGGKGIATSLLGRSAGEGMAKSIAKGAARTGMLAGASGLTEGYQEGAQNALENDVEGNRDGGWYNPFTWTNEDWEAARGGFVGGALMGAPGNVAAGFHPETRQAPLSAESQEQAQSIKDTLSHGKPAGMSNAAYNAYIELANSGNPDLIKQAASSLESFQQSQEGSQESTDDAATEAYKDYETYDQKQEIENFLNNNTVEQIGGEDNFNWLMGVLRNGTPEEVQHAYDTVIAAEKATAEQEAKNRPASGGGSMSPNTGNAMVNIVIQAANDSGVDPRLGLAIAARESGGDDVNAISMPEPHDGIYGIMQAQEETVSNMGLDSQYPDWKTDPYQNAMVGMAILKSKIANENGDVWAGVRDYNGAGEEAEQYRQLVKNNYDNMGDIGGGGGSATYDGLQLTLPDSDEFTDQSGNVSGLTEDTRMKLRVLDNLCYQKFGQHLIVSSSYREGDPNNHGAGVAFDVSGGIVDDPDARQWLEQAGPAVGLFVIPEYQGEAGAEFAHGDNVHFSNVEPGIYGQTRNAEGHWSEEHAAPSIQSILKGGASGGVSGKVTGDNGQFERELDQAAQEAKSDMDKIQAQSDQAMNEIMNDDSAEKTAQDAQQDAENAQKQAEESQQSAQDDVVPDVAQTIRDTSNNIDEINTLDGMFTKDSNGNDKFIDTPENRDFIKTNYKDEIAKAVNDAMSKKKAPSATPVPKAQQQTPHARLGRILSTYDRKDPKFKEYMNTFRNGTEQEQKKLADDLQTTQELERANSLKGNPLTTQQDQNTPQNAPQQAVEATKQPEQINTTVQVKESLETQKKRKIYLAKKQKLMERVPAGKTVKVHASTNDAGFDATYKIVPAGDITASHDMNYAVNDLYPAEYQPRDRNRPQMRGQVEKMTKGMKPELLAESQFVNEGAPVVNNSGVVLNGNGRVMAVQKAYKGLTDAHKKSAKAYKDYLVSIAPSLGIAPEKVQSMDHPVLVRQAADDADTNAIINSTEGGAKLGGAEQAKADADRLKLSTLEQFVDNGTGEFMNPSNREFRRAAASDVFSDAEGNSVFNEKGDLSPTGQFRIRNAIFAKAYNDNYLLTQLSEATDNNSKNIMNAMIAAAPEVAKVNEGIKNGTLYPDYDISDVIAKTAKTIMSLRNEGNPLSFHLQETDLFSQGESEAERLVLEFIERNKFKSRTIADMYKGACDRIFAVGSPKQSKLFDSKEALRISLENIISNAIQEVEHGQSLFDTTEEKPAEKTVSEVPDNRQAEPAGSGRVHQQEAGRVQSQEKEGNEVDEKSKQSDHVDAEPQQTESKDKESTHAEEGSQGDVQEEVSKFHNVLDDEKSTPKQVIDAYKSIVDKVIANANGSRKNAKIGDKIVTDEYQSLTNSKHWGAFMNEDGGRNWHEVATINADAHKTLRAIIKTAGKETAPKAEQSKETKPAEQPKEKAGFTDDEIKTLTDRGFNRWTKKLSNGKVMDRLYIKPEYLGLELTRYKSGNISSAKFNGEAISNSEARRIEGTKCYVDVATKEVVCDRDDLKQVAQEVVDDALSKEKSQVLAQAETKKAAPKDDVKTIKKSLLNLATKVWQNPRAQGKVTFYPSQKLKDKVKELFGHDIDTVFITADDIRHIKSGHSEHEENRGQINLSEQDIPDIYDVVNDFDNATKLQSDAKGNQKIMFVKDVNGKMISLLIERGKHKTQVKTAYKKQVQMSDVTSPEPNVLNDSVPASTSIISQKAEKGNKPDELRNQLSNGGKQAYDYAFDKLSQGHEKVAQSAKESAFIYARMAERWSEIMHEYGNKTYSPEDYTKSHPIVMGQQSGNAQLERAFEQRAWHGSSHDFDKFDLGYIGTGEGAQAHGWGLYFAGNKDISQGYANKLSNPVGEVNVAGIIYSIGRGGGSWRVRNIATGELISKMKIVKAISALYTEQGKDKALKYLKDKADQTRKFKKIWIDAYDWLKNQEVDDSQWHNGKLYEVEIPDIDTLLDEQKSLSEQPSKVKKAILDYYRSRPDEYIAPEDETLTGNNKTGKEFLKDVIFQLRREGSHTPERDASLLLNSFGINGITYYGNRDGRCYVVFDDKAIQIIDKYNQDVHNAKAAYDASTGAIRLFDIADQSSFIHESAHMFLSDMERLAQKKDAPAGLVSDLQTVKDWAGYKPGQMNGYKGTALEKEFQEYADTIREAKKTGDVVAIKSAEARWIHERFARGFERYIAEGKAPNESLKNVFEKFKEWMVSIYHDLKNLGKKPPKEIQDVMTRMITPEVNTKYSVREANGQLTRSKEDLKAEIKEAFPNAKEIKDEGDRMTFTMPNGSHIVVDVKNEILLTDEELAQAKKDHHIDDNGNVVVEGYAQLHGKDAYMALSQGSRENTGFHEAYHLAEGAVLTDREKAAIKKAIPDAEKRADKYAEWVEARKHGRGTAWGKLFQKINDFAAKMRKIFTGVETVNDIFRQIESGRVWEREVNEQNTNNINGEKYYSIRKQDEKISRDAKKKLMKHVEIAQKKADEKDIGVHRTFLQSPSRIAEKKKYFRPFFRMADDAMNLLTKLRADYQRHLDSALNLSKKDKASLQELLWAGDMEGKEYTREELREQGYDEKVIDSYWQIRNLFRKAYNQLNETRKQAKTKTGHFSGRKLDELRHNKFVEILRETEQDDGSTLVSYKEYGNWQSHYLVNEDELKALENDDNIQILEKIPTTEGPMDGQKHWKVTTREGVPDIHDRKGYVPHFFHEYMVRFVDSHGKATVISSGRTIREATKNAIKWQAENEEMLKKRNEGDWKITIAPKVFDFGEIGLDESQYATTVGDKDFYRMEKKIADKHSLTLHEAKEMLDGMVKKKGRHRFFGNFLRRTGADGYEQEIEWVLRHYFNSTSRYVAMESKFKPQAISLFERLFGRFDNEYHGLPNYIKEYINDINGNPSTLEKQLNDLLNAIPAIGKWVNAHVGDRAAVSLANSITNKISIAKLGFLNVSSAMLNILQIANAAAYTGNISTLWKALLKGAHRKYSLHDLKILRETNVLNDIGLDSGAGYGKFSAGKWANRGMILFKESEGIVRRGVTLAAYEAGRKRGMSHEEAIRYAKDVNRKSNFDYGVHDAPGIFRRGSIFSQIFLQFKKYPIKQLEAMKDFLPFFGKGTTKKQKAIFWGTYFAMAGLFQIPFANILGLLIMGITGDDPEKEAKNSLIELAENYPSLKPLAKIGMYGIGTFANIDITSRVGIGDAVPDDLQSLFGPAASTLFNVAKSAYGGDNWTKQVRNISPGLGNLLMAAQGNSVGKRGRVNQEYTTPYQRLLRGMGFQSTDESDSYLIQSILSSEKKKASSKKQQLIDEYIANPTGENARKLKSAGIKPSTVKAEQKKKQLDTQGRTESSMNKNDKKQYKYLLDW